MSSSDVEVLKLLLQQTELEIEDEQEQITLLVELLTRKKFRNITEAKPSHCVKTKKRKQPAAPRQSKKQKSGSAIDQVVGETLAKAAAARQSGTETGGLTFLPDSS